MNRSFGEELADEGKVHVLFDDSIISDPSTLTDLFYTFSGCSHMTTIYADSTWALPSSGITGSQCFYSCSTSLVGGSGTAWSSNKTVYTYFRIDTASTPGYVTVA